jgi:hypothetical protein
VVENEVRPPAGLELSRDAASDTAETADDRVPAQIFDRLSQLALRVRLRDGAVRDQVDDRTGEVEEDCHASDQEQDGEELRACPRRLRVETGERGRDD